MLLLLMMMMMMTMTMTLMILLVLIVCFLRLLGERFVTRFLALMILYMAADKKLFRQISNETHCLHPLCSQSKKENT